MSHILNSSSRQLSLTGIQSFFSEKDLAFLEKSWARPFYEQIFQKIDERPFAVLYSSVPNSRPNAPVNVTIGALILKEHFGLTDEELLEQCTFDFRFRYALNCMDTETFPLSRRTLTRFRTRCIAYELETGTDLIHDCITSLADGIRRFMKISKSVRRMDSMMIESNIRRMGRLELLHTCISNLLDSMQKAKAEIPEDLQHYTDPNDGNKTIYHDADIPYEERFQKAIEDADTVLALCKDSFAEEQDCRLLNRVLEEQTKRNAEGKRIAKEGKADGISSSALQNPSDPDATFRRKAGKEHRGYAANLTECVDQNGSVITDYQYSENTRSDASFMEEYIGKQEGSEEKVLLAADGAYCSQELKEKAEEKNITIETTGLSGKTPRDILADFELTEDDAFVKSCPKGNHPESCSYYEKTDMFRVTFRKEQCHGCPHYDDCHPKDSGKKSVITFTKAGRDNAVERRARKTDDHMKFVCRLRNGIETVPSLIRNKLQADRMPVRGKLRTKLFFGFKVGAANLSKLLRSTSGEAKCRAYAT